MLPSYEAKREQLMGCMMRWIDVQVIIVWMMMARIESFSHSNRTRVDDGFHHPYQLPPLLHLHQNRLRIINLHLHLSHLNHDEIDAEDMYLPSLD